MPCKLMWGEQRLDRGSLPLPASVRKPSPWEKKDKMAAKGVLAIVLGMATLAAGFSPPSMGFLARGSCFHLSGLNSRRGRFLPGSAPWQIMPGKSVEKAEGLVRQVEARRAGGRNVLCTRSCMSAADADDEDAVPVPPSGGGFDGGFMPSDFLKVHEMVLGATVPNDEKDGMVGVGAAVADEMQRAYTMSVCAFDGAADYARKLSTLDESSALKWVRGQTQMLSQDEAVMQIYPEQGKWLAQLVLAMGAKKIMEIGTFTGYSSTSMACSLPADGRLVCLEVDESYAKTAGEAWARSGASDKVELRLGPAVDSLQEMIEGGEAGSYDMVFIDADKENSDEYYEAALMLLRPGGVVMVDDSLWSGRVVDEESHTDRETTALRELNLKMCEDARVMSQILPIADGVTVGVKLPGWASSSGVSWGRAASSGRTQQRVGGVVAVEGNLCSGKTLFSRGVASLSGGDCFVDILHHVQGTPIEEAYMNEPGGAGGGFAFSVLAGALQRTSNALEVATESASSTGGISVLEGIGWSCRAAGASMRSAGYISDAQANAFEGLADASVDESKADLVVVLDVPPEVCLERRLSGAKSTPLPGFGQTQDELEELDTSLFHRVLDAATKRTTPVLVLDWRDFGREEDAFALISACLRGRVALPGVTYDDKVPYPKPEGATVIDSARLEWMSERRMEGEEYMITDPRAGPRTFLQVLAPMLEGGSALGLASSTSKADHSGTVYVFEPGLGASKGAMLVFKRAVMHALSSLRDVVIVTQRVASSGGGEPRR